MTTPNIRGMLSGEKQVRLVIQSIPSRGNAGLQYRVVVYPERQGFHGPLVFSSREELLARLLTVIPQFDSAQVRQPEGAARIVFAGSLDLTDSQIARLYGE